MNQRKLGNENNPCGLIGLSLATLLPSLSTSSSNVALPTLAHAFNASFQDVQWIVLANLLALTTFVVSAGRLGDIFGRRRLLLIGALVFAAASATCAMALNLWALVAARAAQGVGAAAMMALSMSLVSDASPKDKVGWALGVLGATSAVGTSLGPSLGGVLISAFGWQAIFLVNVPIAAVAALLIFSAMPADVVGGERPRFDARGTAVLALTLAAYALAVTVGHGAFGSLNLALLAATAIGVTVFVRLQRATAFPLVQTSLFRQSVTSAGFVMSALITTIVMATLVVGPFYLAGGLGLDASRIGLVMSAGPMVAAISGAPAGRLVDRIGAPPVVIAGIAAVAIGASILPMAAPVLGIGGYVIPLMLITGGYAFFQAANNTGVMTTVSREQRGVVSGLLNLSRNLGLITGAAVMGAIFAYGSGASDIARASASAVTTGLQFTFAAAALVSFATLALAIRTHASVLSPRRD